jgi:hypothetical protein
MIDDDDDDHDNDDVDDDFDDSDNDNDHDDVGGQDPYPFLKISACLKKCSFSNLSLMLLGGSSKAVLASSLKFCCLWFT